MACRMFGYSGNSEADVRALYNGLRQACSNDPTLTAVAEGCSRHCHGWGYVIHAGNGLFHYRSGRSIYEDDITLPKLNGRIYAIFHGRYASDPSLAGHIFSHPFLMTNEREVIYMAHNGGVRADPIKPRVVDSEWATEELASAPNLEAALPKLKEHTKSALNLLVLRIGRGEGTPVSLDYFHYFKPKEPDKTAYYRMFEADLPGGRAVVSSTLTFADANVTALKNIRPAEFEKLVLLG